MGNARNHDVDLGAGRAGFSKRMRPWKFHDNVISRLPRCFIGRDGYKYKAVNGDGQGQYPPLQLPSLEIWFNRPTYNSYTPYGYGYSSFEDPYARAVARERAARQRDAAARRVEPHRWQQMQGAARPPYNSCLDGNTSISYLYNLRAHDYTTHKDLKKEQILERQRQPELARQATEDMRRKGPESQRNALPSFKSPHPLLFPFRDTAYKAHSVFQICTPATLAEASDTGSSPGHVVSIAELSTNSSWFTLPQRGSTTTVPPRRYHYHPCTFRDIWLAFTPNSKVVHEYIENLSRLFDKLDRTESGGHASVREQRKQMIRNVEAEAQRMDCWIAGVWRLTQPDPQPNRRLRPRPTMEDVSLQKTDPFAIKVRAFL
ncbi:hypothetical protein BDM02DRAFT_3184298 [Thelephora ganbajun]|uniref:Uncharacterized protein n=1 Tax=Thelephora ganbajun TaxID=370292 RepID=A0ACB6ZQX9_THEGA|nr:hypothetical protein BDM02DRAFT_3184298 [Thelephora ganbajun]